MRNDEGGNKTGLGDIVAAQQDASGGSVFRNWIRPAMLE